MADASQTGSLKKAKRPDYMVNLRRKGKDYEIGYLETGKPNSNHTKQVKDHFKLNQLAKAAVNILKQSKNQRLLNTPSIFTINVAGDRLEVRYMYKYQGFYRNCLIEQARIPLCISHAQPDDVYSLIHALLTFRTAIVCNVYKMFYKESSTMLIDNVSSAVETSAIETSAVKTSAVEPAVETSSMMSFEYVETSSMMSFESNSSLGKRKRNRKINKDYHYY